MLIMIEYENGSSWKSKDALNKPKTLTWTSQFLNKIDFYFNYSVLQPKFKPRLEAFRILSTLLWVLHTLTFKLSRK